MKLEIVLGGAATNEAHIHVAFYDVPAREKSDFSDYQMALRRAVSNDTTDVEICAAPTLAGTVRVIQSLTVHNREAASAIVATIKTDDGTTEYIVTSQSLAAGETLWYERGAGWGIL